MNREQFIEWREHPITKEIFDALRETRDLDAQSLMSGGTLATDVGETSQLTARLVGKIQGINQILDLDFEEEEQEKEKG